MKLWLQVNQPRHSHHWGPTSPFACTCAASFWTAHLGSLFPLSSFIPPTCSHDTVSPSATGASGRVWLQLHPMSLVCPFPLSLGHDSGPCSSEPRLVLHIGAEPGEGKQGSVVMAASQSQKLNLPVQKLLNPAGSSVDTCLLCRWARQLCELRCPGPLRPCW